MLEDWCRDEGGRWVEHRSECQFDNGIVEEKSNGIRVEDYDGEYWEIEDPEYFRGMIRGEGTPDGRQSGEVGVEVIGQEVNVGFL